MDVQEVHNVAVEHRSPTADRLLACCVPAGFCGEEEEEATRKVTKGNGDERKEKIRKGVN